MQFYSYKWKVIPTAISFSLLVVSGTRAQGIQAGCATDPMSLRIPEMHLRGEDAVQALTRIAFNDRICLGVENLEQTENRVSLDLRSGPLKEALNTLFPDYIVSSAGEKVLSLKPRNADRSWLDYRLKMFKANRVSLNFDSMQLFLFLQDQAGPHAGYIGSFSEPVTDNYVGPISEQNRTIRELLNLLLARSTGGGMWLTRRSPPRNEPLSPSGPFWTMVPFGGSLKNAISRLNPMFS